MLSPPTHKYLKKTAAQHVRQVILTSSPKKSLLPYPLYMATEHACLVPTNIIDGPWMHHPSYMLNPLVIAWPIFYACRDLTDSKRNIPPVSYEQFLNHAEPERSFINGGTFYRWLVITHYGISGVITITQPGPIYQYGDSNKVTISGISLPLVRNRKQARQVLQAVLNHEFFYYSTFSAFIDNSDTAVSKVLENSGFQPSWLFITDNQRAKFGNRHAPYFLTSKSQQDEKIKIRFTYSGKEVELGELLDELDWVKDFLKVESECSSPPLSPVEMSKNFSLPPLSPVEMCKNFSLPKFKARFTTPETLET